MCHPSAITLAGFEYRSEQFSFLQVPLGQVLGVHAKVAWVPPAHRRTPRWGTHHVSVELKNLYPRLHKAVKCWCLCLPIAPANVVVAEIICHHVQHIFGSYSRQDGARLP